MVPSHRLHDSAFLFLFLVQLHRLRHLAHSELTGQMWYSYEASLGITISRTGLLDPRTFGVSQSQLQSRFPVGCNHEFPMYVCYRLCTVMSCRFPVRLS
ncbi:hypothetical protein BZA77DRAFT_42725 [Pyronema omphalodes]|nr:hypothetical protein BZA77DRAFT_42725 [Pyronema omphalodes]